MPLNPDCASLGVYDIYRICFLFWVSESKRRRAAKKHKGGRARRESSALICWHGNTDFFVSPRRERRQRILGITGMMTGGKHAQTDTETGARLSRAPVEVTTYPRGTREGALLLLSRFPSFITNICTNLMYCLLSL